MSELHLVTEDSRPALEAFLFEHAPIAMYPLTNLREHGMSGDHPKAMTFWMNTAGTDVLSKAGHGMVMPIFTSPVVPGIKAALAGQSITGCVGTRAGVAAVAQAVEFPPAALDRIEAHYELDLNDLDMPDVTGLRLVPLSLVPRPILVSWRTDYYIEALAVPAAEAPPQAMAFVDSALESGNYHVLMEGEVPLSITGFNARLPQIVMIGGVFTPKHLRGRGYAGKALALHLKAAQSAGVKRAVLSAANAVAGRAYERIGFRKMGEFDVKVFHEPVQVDG